MPSLTRMNFKFVLAGVIDTPSQLGSHSSRSQFGEDICNLLMCRKVLHEYDFPLHLISEIRMFHLIVFRSIRKHWVLKELLLTTFRHHHKIHLMVKQICQKLLNPHYFAHLMLIYSASMVLNAIEFCFLLHQETMANFKVEHQPDVFFQFTVLSSQSESTYPTKSSSYWSHISGHIQLCLVYTCLLSSSESVLVDS